MGLTNARQKENESAEGTRPRALTFGEGQVGIGLFLPNESWSYWPTVSGDGSRWSYPYNRDVVRLAESLGFNFAFPAARWKGLPGDHIDWRGASLDTITLTAGLLEATSTITLLTTIHTNVFNPVVAAKLGADLDHIGQGRWGLNIVSGWNAEEFGSMGIPLLDHKERYSYTREWLDIVETLWAEGKCVLHGRYFEIIGAEVRPGPVQRQPLIVNAGQSYTGMRFAAERADFLFSRGSNAEKFRAVATEVGSSAGFIGTRKVVLGRTDGEAMETAESIRRGLDEGAIRNMMIVSGAETPESSRKRLAQEGAAWEFVLEDGVVGGPERVASELAVWATDCQVDGICLTLYNYLEDLELFGSEVLPRLGEYLSDRGRHLALNEVVS